MVLTHFPSPRAQIGEGGGNSNAKCKGKLSKQDAELSFRLTLLWNPECKVAGLPKEASGLLHIHLTRKAYSDNHLTFREDSYLIPEQKPPFIRPDHYDTKECASF